MKNKEPLLNYCEVVISSSDDAIISKDLDGLVLSWNNSAERIFGYSRSEIVGKSITKLFQKDQLDEEQLILEKIKLGQKIDHYETIRLHKDGSKIHVSISLSPIYDDSNQVVGIVKIAKNITENYNLKLKIETLNLTLNHYESIIVSSDDAIISKDLNGVVTSWNEGAQKLFGFTESEMIGNPMVTIFPEDRLSEEAAILERISLGERIEHYETIRKNKSGDLINVSVTVSPIFNGDNKVIGASKIARNITNQVKEQETILYQATHDSLTSLPNRRNFLDTLDLLLSQSKLQKKQLAIAIIDLDFFKEINDKLGHRLGDQVLIQVANSLSITSDLCKFVGRMGGDEFVIIVKDFNHLFEVEVILQRLLSSLQAIKEVDGNKINLTASIGVSVYPNDSDKAEELLVKTDQALYEAKSLGRNQFKFFTKELEKKVSRKKVFITEILKAFRENQFHLVFQPIINIKTQKCEKLEALSRWSHPELGDVSPDVFIPIIEELGLIGSFTDWVFNEVIVQKKKFDLKYSPNFEVSINMSPQQLASKKLSTLNWEKALKTNHIKPSSIIFELTENSLINNLNIVTENLAAIKSIGIQIAIDDFGTGYSSLSYLHRLNIDYIKIDKSFVSLIGSSNADSVLCDVMISMAHRLKLKVIAEGVETKTQLDYLTNHDCDYIQGYYFSKPQLANDLDLNY